MSNQYHPCSVEFQAEARKLGLTGYQYVQKLKQEGILKPDYKIKREEIDNFAKNKGFKNYNEYLKAGYRRNPSYYIDKVKNRYYYQNGGTPKEENFDCATYFGYVNEELFNIFLYSLFENVKWLNLEGKENKNNINFIVSKPRKEFLIKYPILARYFKDDLNQQNQTYKIALLGKSLIDNRWEFAICNNTYADLFILCGWAERDDLTPIHVWLFPRDAKIRKNGYGLVEFYRRNKKVITNRPDYILENSKWEIKDIDKLKEIWNDIRER